MMILGAAGSPLTPTLIVLLVSLALQLTAAVLAIRLIRLSGTLAPWGLICVAAVLMAIRRSMALGPAFRGEGVTGSFGAEVVALVISLLLVVGLAQLGPFFSSSREAREKLHRSEAKYRMLVDLLPQPVFEVDLRGRFTFVNRASLKVFGYDPRDVREDDDVFRMLAPEERDRARENMTRVASGELGPGREYVALRRDGTRFPAMVYSGVMLEQGKPVGLRGIVIDLTEQRRLEEELLKAQKMEAVGRLAGGVAHDFNNILTVISGRTGLLLRRLDVDDPSRRDADEVKKAADHAATLTRQLLAFSRRQIMVPRVLDLNVVVSGVNTMLRRLIGEDIDLVTLQTPDLWRVKADPGQIEQVIMNLAVNSRDAMPDGGKLTLGMSNVTVEESDSPELSSLEPGPYVMLTVSDTGVGMDDSVKARLFEPFFTTKAIGKGTGLGLATTYGIVTQSGGAISVESEPGFGSTFRIYLPRVDGASAEEETLAAKACEEQRAWETVLLVEDEDTVRDITKQYLVEAGYEVLAAGDSVEALAIEQAREGPIHLLLTDVILPGISGPALAKELKVSRSDIRVLYTSGYTDDALAPHRILEEGASFLPKPWSPEVLCAAVRDALREPAGSPDAGGAS